MSQNSTQKITHIAVAVMAASLYGHGARAQETSASDTSDALTEVIVTANRVEQNAQKVAAAVQVVQGADLSAQALTDIGAIFADTPSVNITAQPAGFSINIRGQMGDGPSGKQQGAVASEFDGIYNITALSTEVGFFDMDRMEVLPGPQSTQYGPNADGGVVNAISKDPTFGNLDGTGTLTYGNYNLRRGEFGQNVPISDTLAVRISGAFIDRGSYTEPATTNQIAQSGRVKLLWEPSATFSLKAWVQVDHQGGTGNGLEPILFGVVAPYTNGDINTPSYACNPNNFKQYAGLDCANPWDHGNSDNNGTTAAISHSDLFETTYAAKLSWQFSDSAVLDITPSQIIGSGTQSGWYTFAGGGPGGTGWNTYSAKYNPGYVFSNTVQYPFDPFHEFATEVRLHNAPSSNVIWSVGYYLWQYKDIQWSNQQPPGQAGPLYGNYSATTTNAVFGDITYPVTDSLRVIAGLRESGDERTAHQVLSPGNISIDTLNFNHFDYRLGEEKDLGAHAMEYFTFATGYRPGGLSYQGNTSTWYASGNEVNDAAELGLKSRWLDNKLQVNIDGFYYFEQNYQENDNYTPYLPVGTGGITATAGGSTNICYTQGPGAQAPAICNLPVWQPDVRAYGVETQIKYDVTHDDRVSVSGTFEKSVFERNAGGCATVGYTGSAASSTCAYGANLDGGFAQAGLVFVNIQGLTTAHSPEWAGNFGYDHVFHLADYSLDLGATAFYSDWYYAHPVISPIELDIQPAYWLENAQINFAPDNGRWSLNAYVRNLTNYAVKESYLPAGTLGDPRLYGITASVKW